MNPTSICLVNLLTCSSTSSTATTTCLHCHPLTIFMHHDPWNYFFGHLSYSISIAHSRVLVCFNCSNVLSNWTDSAFSMLPVYKELISAGLKIWVFRYAALLLLLSFNLPYSMHRIHTYIHSTPLPCIIPIQKSCNWP